VKDLRFDVRITLLRQAVVDDGLQSIPGGVPEVLGTVWASRVFVSDGERLKSGQQAAELIARYVVRATAVTRGITAKDLLREGSGRAVGIFGAKPVRNGQLIEITTQQRSDQGVSA
jgi:head-tail adaptor